MKTIVGLFDTNWDAQNAVNALHSAGIADSDISLVAHQSSYSEADRNLYDNRDHPVMDGAGTGAKVGAWTGGFAGLLAGLGMIAVPGFGTVAAAGWLAATLTGAGIGAATGAVIGGLAGALSSVGVPENEAGYYAEGVRRGGTLVTVRAQDVDAQRVADILNGAGAINIDQRADYYRSTGYSGYNASLQPFTSEEIQRDRAAYRSYTPSGSTYGTTGGTTAGNVDTRGVGERVADAVTGDRVDDKTGRVVR